MSGQPTKRGNWGTWAVIDYSGRRKYYDEMPPSSSRYKAVKSLAPDYICKFATHDEQYLCTNPSSVWFKRSCNSCLLKVNTTVKFGKQKVSTRQELQALLKITASSKKKNGRTNQCVYKDGSLCRKAELGGSCFSDRTQCIRFRGANETNELCIYHDGSLSGQCALPQHKACNLTELCDDYRRKQKPQTRKNPYFATQSCLFRRDLKCLFGIEPCVNCDSCNRFRGVDESNTKCKYNFGVEHNKCALFSCVCDKYANCGEYIRKPILVKKYDRIVVISKE